jgi:hypothetical protein
MLARLGEVPDGDGWSFEPKRDGFGRDDEMRAVCRALTDDGAWLVTLIGPGGIGKTRLALQAAAELSGSFEDGVFFVDLSLVREPDSAFEAMVLVIGEPRSAEPAVDQLGRSLQGSACCCSSTTSSK